MSDAVDPPMSEGVESAEAGDVAAAGSENRNLVAHEEAEHGSRDQVVGGHSGVAEQQANVEHAPAGEGVEEALDHPVSLPPAALELEQQAHPASASASVLHLDHGHDPERDHERSSGVNDGEPRADRSLEPESHHRPDSPTLSLIESLRSQLSLISDQAQALNAKLVASISIHAELEDQHFHLQATHRDLQAKTEALEKDKRSWEESINSGLLVERSQIRDEMQRLAAGLVEEERRRGSAEEKREAVEGEINDLTAKLFLEAQAMVAVEHMARAQAEDRLKTTVDNLAAAEAAMRDMQLHLQSLPSSSAPISPPTTSRLDLSVERKYLSSHVPFAEFITFLQHLRALRPLRETSKNAFPPPQIVHLLAQPFLARTITEDHDPTIRLDAAPDISWLSRKGVSNAIISGDLVIEPVPAESVIANSSGNMHDISCSLCGKPVFPPLVAPASPAGSHFGPPPAHPTAHRAGSGGRFSLRPFFNTTSSTTSPSSSPMASPGPHHTQSASVHSTVFIFRVAKPTTTAAAPSEKEQIRLYPLCKSGWCLDRLRATCELWYFIRTGIIHVVWHGDDGYTLASEETRPNHLAPLKRVSVDSGTGTATGTATGEMTLASTLPKRKSAWGIGLGSTAGWTKAFSTKYGTASPPVSPGAEKRGSFTSLVEEGQKPAGDDQAAPRGSTGSEEKEKEGLGAPLEITEQPRSAVVPTIQEPESSPVAAVSQGVTSTSSESKTEAEYENEAGRLTTSPSLIATETLAAPPPPLVRADSERSVDSEAHTDEATFSTPRGLVAEFPEPHYPDQRDQEVESNSPVVAPPPVPRRATARGVPDSPAPSNGTADTEKAEAGVESDANAESEITAVSVDKEASVDKAASGDKEASADKEESEKQESLDGTATPHVESDAHDGRNDKAGVIDLSEKHVAEARARPQPPPQPPRRAAPPPLPPRHPRTPTTQVADSADNQVSLGDAEGLKAFLSPEGWEARTWRTVIKLKEGMWKARIGVVDADE